MYNKWINKGTKTNILIKNKYFFNLKILSWFILKNYLYRNNIIELTIKIAQRITVVLCNTFSVHLFVIVHIQPHILVKFNDIFLFCISTIKISITDIITSKIFKYSVIFYFLKNNNE